jgi:hypothetical protein
LSETDCLPAVSSFHSRMLRVGLATLFICAGVLMKLFCIGWSGPNWTPRSFWLTT